LITCSSAATSRRSEATGACSASREGQDPLLDLQVPTVDPVVVVDDDRRELDVLMLERLERSIQRRDDEVDAPEGLDLQLMELFVELLAAWHPSHCFPNPTQPNRPLT
jgi:hypothetical protein